MQVFSSLTIASITMTGIVSTLPLLEQLEPGIVTRDTE